MDIDFWLIQRMKQGDEEAFDLFIRKYYEKILNYCGYHCSDISYAEDLTQETFVRFFTKLSDYRHMGKTINYLYTIAGNLCRDYLKKTKDDLLEQYDTAVQNTDNRTEADEISDRLALRTALEHLPEEFREIVILYYFQNMKLAEISDVLQVGLPLVKYRLRQAKLKLKYLLED